MTTVLRDTATRCTRCQRVVTGCAPFVVTELVELAQVEVAHATLCVRCRGELRDVIAKTLAGDGVTM